MIRFQIEIEPVDVRVSEDEFNLPADVHAGTVLDALRSENPGASVLDALDTWDLLRSAAVRVRITTERDAAEWTGTA